MIAVDVRMDVEVLVRCRRQTPGLCCSGTPVSASGHYLFTDPRRKSKAMITGEQPGLGDPGFDRNEFRLRKGVGGKVRDNFGLHGKFGLFSTHVLRTGQKPVIVRYRLAMVLFGEGPFSTCSWWLEVQHARFRFAGMQEHVEQWTDLCSFAPSQPPYLPKKAVGQVLDLDIRVDIYLWALLRLVRKAQGSRDNCIWRWTFWYIRKIKIWPDNFFSFLPSNDWFYLPSSD